MRHARSLLPALVSLVLVSRPVELRAAEDFPLHDGDTWVMAGDSITAQHLHSNYFEAFCFARYPNIQFRFRNAGVGGDMIPRVLARYDWDIAPWKPTVVSVELGMNDKGSYSAEQFIENMGKLDARIRQGGSRPVYFTSSPINDGSTAANAVNNGRLDQYAVALKKFADEHDAPFADQFHRLIDVWARNKPAENRANFIAAVMAATRDENLRGVHHLRNFLEENQQDELQPVSMMGDPVHPGPPGQLTMAAALLLELGADGFVSSAIIDASGKVVDSDGCTITDARSQNGRLTFTRLDEQLPFPIPSDGRAAISVFPQILELSRYTLKVTGLAKGDYELRVNGAKLGKASAENLSLGVNLTAFADGAIAAQGKRILDAVSAKEAVVSRWRGLARAQAAGGGHEATAEMKELQKVVLDKDEQIRKAAEPDFLRFEVAPTR